MSRTTRVLIADDHEDSSIPRLLEAQEDLDVVGHVTDGLRLVSETLHLVPDVLILDLSLAGGGLRALEQLAGALPQTKTVVLAANEDIRLLRTVLATRALGYVVYRGSKAELLSVVRKIAQGRGYVDVPTGGLPMDPALLQQPPRRPDLQEKLDMLSKRESEVLRAVAYGFTNREIAEHLGISVKSIETYRYRVSEKLDFNSRAELVRFALEAGLLQMGGQGLPEAEA
ncbi:MAG: response regulator transcription factor [Acidobacteriota bacterium]